jgi:hypothetical protein
LLFLFLQIYPGCGNDDLKGTNIGDESVDGSSAELLSAYSQRSCTKYNTPYEKDETRSVLHFARMWYDLVVDSPAFLGIVQGESDPYAWTTGGGCGYTLGGQRASYTNQSESDILLAASGKLYYIDEGVSVGAVDRNLLIGGTTPSVDESSPDNPLTSAAVMQSIYPALIPKHIVQRVKNCNRPNGPTNITLEDAEEILYRYKEAFEDTWSKGWDKDGAGKVQFVGFFDGK